MSLRLQDSETNSRVNKIFMCITLHQKCTRCHKLSLTVEIPSQYFGQVYTSVLG